MFFFLRNYNFSKLESLVGCAIFYTARPVIQNAGSPMVDASSYFFLLLCLYAIQQKRILMFLIGFTIGLLAKESVFLALFLLIFSKVDIKFKLKTFCFVSPIVLAYLFFRHTFVQFEALLEDIDYISTIKYQLYDLTHFNKLLDLFSSFGLFWVPATLALKYQKLPQELYRYSLLIPLLLVIIVLFGLNLGRALFISFPVVIPLALFGIRLFYSKD